MYGMNAALLVLHFIGLTMGFSVSIGSMVMLGVMAASPAAERPVLARFMPAISRVGRMGLVLLWVTGLAMLYTKWNGFASMPWQFHAKITAVILLTIAVTYLFMLEQRIKKGDSAAAVRLQQVGKMTPLFALAAVIFAVLTFE